MNVFSKSLFKCNDKNNSFKVCLQRKNCCPGYSVARKYFTGVMQIFLLLKQFFEIFFLSFKIG